MKKRSTLLSSVAMIVILCLLVTGVSWPTDVKAANEWVLFNKDNVSASYIIDSSWEGAFNATVTVKNDSEKDIEDWRISFDYCSSLAGMAEN